VLHKSVTQSIHWSKDFVEHLRTVHFALIVISVGLILLVLSSKEYNPITALVQIEEIIDLKHQWSYEWMSSHLVKASRIDYFSSDDPPGIRVGSPNGYSAFPAELVWTKGSIDTSLLNHTRNRVLAVCYFPKNNWWRKNIDDHWPLRATWSPDEFPRNLVEFRQWWNTLASSFLLELPIEVPSITSPATNSIGTVRFLNHKTPLDRASLPEIQFGIDFGQYSEKERRAEYFYYLDSGKRLIVPIVSSLEFEMNQESITKVFPDMHPGLFENSFSDLSTAAQRQMGLPFEDLKEFVHDEASKGPEIFEAFGIKFPARQVTVWGETLVLAVQLYIFIYLRQLTGKLKASDPGWDVPWIGMDQWWVARVSLFSTLVLMPCIAVVLLGCQASARLSAGYWVKTGQFVRLTTPLSKWNISILRTVFSFLLAIVVSISLGVLSWRNRPKLSSTPSCPSQLFE
jgi:hypothetical protein